MLSGTQGRAKLRHTWYESTASFAVIGQVMFDSVDLLGNALLLHSLRIICGARS